MELYDKVEFKVALEKLAVRTGVELNKPSPPKETWRSGDKLVATYPYVDENGKLLYEVVRYGAKSFKQRRPNGRGAWLWKLDDVGRVLFRLPEVLQAVQDGSDIWITEGEKDTLALVKAGVCATTAAQGAASP